VVAVDAEEAASVAELAAAAAEVEASRAFSVTPLIVTSLVASPAPPVPR
jgi:hypothetical protein